MTPDNIIVLVILITAVVLFISEKLRADIVALLVLLALNITQLVTIEEAFEGFANPAVVTVWAVFIISGAIQRSGLADLIGRQLLRWGGQNETRLLTFLMIGAGILSAFMNNVGAVAILMPTVISIGQKLNISSSKLLMPLAFSALMGGNLTLIGTPPNILASSIMQSYGVPPFRFFDFAPTGILVLAAGIPYMLLMGRKLIPDRVPPGGLSQGYHVKEFLTQAMIAAESPLIGKQLNDTDLGFEYNLNVVYVRPTDDNLINPIGEYKLKENDVLLLKGEPQDIIHASDDYRLIPVPDLKIPDLSAGTDLDEIHFAEITLTPNSNLKQQTLKEINFRDKYGLSVLAVRHNGRDQVNNLADLPIQFGDSLFVQGAEESFDNLQNDNNLLVLERPTIEKRRTDKIPFTSIVLLGVIILASFGVLHVAALMLAGALLMVIGGVLNMDEAYRFIDWKAIFIIAGLLPLGTAMETTMTAQLIANQLIGLTGDMGPVATLCTIFILTALLTEVISNAAAAVLVVPIAIDIAFSLHLNPQPFVMATVIASSTSFLTPIGHQVNIIIFGAGGYKFFDYTRVGLGLNLILFLISAIFIPIIWSF